MGIDGKRSALYWTCGLAVLAAAYRAWLARIFWGHEEEDWANLIHIDRIAHSLRSGTAFGENFVELIDLEHMPLFTWLCGSSAALVGDAQLGAGCITILMGAITVGLVTWIGWRWLSPAAGIIAGLLVTFQPEAALYASSPLRESTYHALMLGGVALVGTRRFGLATLLLALAFLCRFNIAFSILPALLLWGLLQWRETPAEQRRDIIRGPMLTVAAVLLVVLAWAAFYRSHSDSGSWVFWGGVVDKNAGRAVLDLAPNERIEAIGLALGGVFTAVLPRHFGWLASVLAVLGLVRLKQMPGSDIQAARWLRLAGLSTLALFAITAVVSAYPPDHNLYWKWLCPSVPYLALFAAHAAVQLLTQLRQREPFGRNAALAAALVLALSTAWDYSNQTRHQVGLSEEYAGTQVRLARWVEDDWPAGTAVLTAFGEIAHLYLSSRPSAPRAFDWLQHAPRDDRGALGAWLEANRVGLLLWYHEEWTGASDVAGFLAERTILRLTPTVLVEPIARVDLPDGDRPDGAGFTVYQVRTANPVFGPARAAPEVPNSEPGATP